ncbi:MAG: hypothetical protein ACI4MG_09890 [Aristaeellaceae bacterium]
MSQSIQGPLTGADLTMTAPFLHPWEADPWGRLRPPLSVEALQMSAELASGSQPLRITPWLRAGWREVTVQVDGALTALDADWDTVQARLQRKRLRAIIRGSNPVRQVRGALRERETSTTGKAIVMLHPAENGRYVVAICFMGTGTRFYDWFSNFRISTPEGVHKGFKQLTDLFEGNETQISFPETARELNLERLTLAHIIEEMKSANSRFVLWLSGHSQGGAVMQLYAHRKLTEDGVFPMNVVGYGFASPSVMTGDAVAQPEAYPLYHVHNSDDLVPRCGAALHLGVCLTYDADEALRRACYGWPRDEAAVQARIAARAVVREMTDTPSCLLQVMAYLTALEDATAAEVAHALGLSDAPAVSRLIEVADMGQLLRALNRRLQAAYQSAAGAPPAPEDVSEAAERIRRIIGEIGLKPLSGALLQLMRYPHRITARRDSAFTPPYVWIAVHGTERLIPSIWQSGLPPKRLYVLPSAEKGTEEGIR